jgi:uncharacterized LabA/DUF88 family protein
MIPRERLALFVDGANMFYAQRENGWWIDWEKVYRRFCGDRNLYGAFYFTATPPAGEPERVQKYRGFKKRLQHIGFRVVDKEVKVIQDSSGQVKLKGNLDIELVFRMLSGISSYDELILMGGDSDYVPIIDHLVNLGKFVVCVGRRASTAIELINAASKFIDLTDIRQDIERPRPPARPEGNAGKELGGSHSQMSGPRR